MILPSNTHTKTETICSTTEEQDKTATLASHPTDTKVQLSSLPLTFTALASYPTVTTISSLPLTFTALASYPTVTTIPSDQLAFYPVHIKPVAPRIRQSEHTQ